MGRSSPPASWRIREGNCPASEDGSPRRTGTAPSAGVVERLRAEWREQIAQWRRHDRRRKPVALPLAGLVAGAGAPVSCGWLHPPRRPRPAFVRSVLAGTYGGRSRIVAVECKACKVKYLVVDLPHSDDVYFAKAFPARDGSEAFCDGHRTRRSRTSGALWSRLDNTSLATTGAGKPGRVETEADPSGRVSGAEFCAPAKREQVLGDELQYVRNYLFRRPEVEAGRRNALIITEQRPTFRCVTSTTALVGSYARAPISGDA